MKRKLSLILFVIFLFTFSFGIFATASDISLYNNNTAMVSTGFSISETGLATVGITCLGYPDVTTRIEVDIHIEKRNFFFFWENARHEIYVVYTDEYFDEHTYQLEEKGTYRCTVTYTVSGTGGEDDVLTYERTESW